MPTNTARAIRARTVLIDNFDSLECNVIDLLTDLMHMCREDEIDFVRCHALAEIHFNAEIAEEL